MSDDSVVRAWESGWDGHEHAQLVRMARLKCPTHGIRQLKVPSAEPGLQFTAMFEALAIDWLKQASVSAVAKHLRISWDETVGIQSRAVKRGLARRAQVSPKYVGVDETSFQKRHECVTVVSDLERAQVLHVADDRTMASLDSFWASLPKPQLVAIEAIAMDMCAPHIQSTLLHVPAADEKIVFDKFYIARWLNQALDQVRRAENRALRAEGDTSLGGTRFDWLRHPANFTRDAAREFETLRARVHRLARTLRNYWDEIENYFRHRITNAGAEAINTKIQQVKRRSRGFRNRERFREAIYFRCGGLDLYPTGVARAQ